MKIKKLIALCCIILTSYSCSFKLGRHTFRDREFEQARNASNIAFDLEGHYPTKFDRNTLADLSLGITAVEVKSEGKLQTTKGTIPAFSSTVADIRLTGRFYPLKRKAISPFLGGGLAWYRFHSTSTGAGREIKTPDCPLGSRCYEIVEENKTIATGVFPHGVVGFNIPLGEEYIFVTEMRYDLLKENKGYNLKGYFIMAGLRLYFGD